MECRHEQDRRDGRHARPSPAIALQLLGFRVAVWFTSGVSAYAEAALVAKAPVHSRRSEDARDQPSEVSPQRQCPRAEAQAVVDHRMRLALRKLDLASRRVSTLNVSVAEHG